MMWKSETHLNNPGRGTGGVIAQRESDPTCLVNGLMQMGASCLSKAQGTGETVGDLSAEQGSLRMPPGQAGVSLQPSSHGTQ